MTDRKLLVKIAAGAALAAAAVATVGTTAAHAAGTGLGSNAPSLINVAGSGDPTHEDPPIQPGDPDPIKVS
ncbi:hypothetical protein CU254_23185 [Amycolatopsis sp. AA4]|uniref:hypothetical protein n=1 Tax=Actinomycetes TaxID=1760 RepID=UPI0001B54B2E|nr:MULTISPECIES: hypothetical protein [Actinomycetes]ATY13023.1 hypothetical protein CU254_23185 [Amycolatopsis sp. AA4]EFL08894.1 predicted protein [Streptomyces sp. AA4]